MYRDRCLAVPATQRAIVLRATRSIQSRSKIRTSSILRRVLALTLSHASSAVVGDSVRPLCRNHSLVIGLGNESDLCMFTSITFIKVRLSNGTALSHVRSCVERLEDKEQETVCRLRKSSCRFISSRCRGSQEALDYEIWPTCSSQPGRLFLDTAQFSLFITPKIISG